MPTTSVNVTFQGKDNGVVPLIDRITGALQKMQKTASEAGSSVSKFMDDLEAKSKTASESVEKLNQSVKDIGGAKAFKDIAKDAGDVSKAMKDAGTAGTQAAEGIKKVDQAAAQGDANVKKLAADLSQLKNQAGQANSVANNPLVAAFAKPQQVNPLLEALKPQPQQQASILQQLSGFAQQAQGTLSNIFQKAQTGSSNLFNSMFSSFGQGGPQISNLLAPIGNAITGFFSSTASKVANFMNPVNLFKGIGSGISSVFSGWQNAINSVTAGASSNNAIVAALAGTYKTLANTLLGATNVVSNFGASIRQMGQGLQSVGVLLTGLISVPVGGWLRSIISDAIQFQSALVQVEIDSSLGADGVKKLGENIRQISTEVPVATDVLLHLADVYGKLGVSSVDAQSKAVESTAKLAVATNEDAGSIADAYGKLGVIYYKNADDFVAAQDKIGSALVNLSRKNQVSVNEILKGSLNFAPLAAQLKIPLEEVLALTATVASRSSSAARAGTQIGAGLTALTKTKDIEKLAYALGTTTDQILQMERANPAGFFEDMAASIGNIEDPIKRVQAATALFGGAGAKGIQAMSANLPDLAANLELANTSFEKGVALQQEYEAAMESVQNQLQLLKNNVSYVGSIFGEAILPYITKFVALAVPALQLLAEYFKGLGESTKLSVVGFALLAAAIGPVVIALGSFLFSMGIIITGLVEFVEVIGGLIGGVVAFGGAIIGLLSPFNVVGAIISSVAVAAYEIESQLDASENVVVGYIQAAYSWGFNLMTSFGDGIYSAASYIYSAVVDVINSFISLIQAFSPPKAGPLTQISVWGGKLFTAYADGFKKGDMSGIVQKAGDVMTAVRNIIGGLNDANLDVFSDTLSSVKSVISAVGANLGKSQEQIQQWMATATQSVGNFISSIQNGAGGNLNPIAQMLGGLGKDFENLIRLQSEYANQQQRLHDIENALKGINNETDKNIAKILQQTNLTAEQQAAAIRQARVQASLKADALNAEKADLEVSSDNLKEQADRQKKTIDILQSLIFPKIQNADASGSDAAKKGKKPPKPKKPKKPPKPPDVPKFDFSPLERGGSVADSLKKKFDDTSASTDGFIQKLSKAKEVIEGFIAGITGQNGVADWASKPAEFWKGFESGQNIRLTVLDFLEKVQGYKDKLAAVGGALSKGFESFVKGAQDGFFGLTSDTSGLTKLEGILYKIGVAAGIAVLGVSLFLGSIATKIGEVSKQISDAGLEDPISKVQEAWTAFVNAIDPDGTLTEKWDRLGTALNTIANAILGMAGAILKLTWDNLDKVADAIGRIVGFVADSVLSIVGFVASIASIILIAAGYGSVKELGNNLGLINKNLEPYAEGISDGVKSFVGFISSLVQAAKDSATLSAFATGLGKISASLTELAGKSGGQAAGEHGRPNSSTSLNEGIATLETLVKKVADMIASAEKLKIESLGALFQGVYDGATLAAKAGDEASKIKGEDIQKLLDLFKRIVDAVGSKDSEQKANTTLSVFYTLGYIFGTIGRFVVPDVTGVIKVLGAIEDGLKIIDNWKTTTAGEKFKALGNIASTLGSALNPFTKLAEWIVPSKESIEGAYNKFNAAVEDLFSRIMARLRNPISTGGRLGGKSGGSSDGSSAVGGILESIFSFPAATVAKVEKTASATVAGLMGSISTAASTAKTMTAAGLTAGQNMVDKIMAGVTQFFGAKGTLATVGSNIRNMFLDAIELITKGLNTAGEFISGHVKDGITNWFSEVKNFETSFSAMVTSIAAWIVANFQRLVDRGIEAGKQVVEGIRQHFAAAAEYVGEIPKAIESWIKTNFQQLVNSGVAAGKEIVKGIIQAIENKSGEIWDAIKKAIGLGVGSDKTKEDGGGGGGAGAAGGYRRAGDSVMVGEEGREIITFARDGYIIPHRQSEDLLNTRVKASDNTTVVNITVNVQGNASAADARRIADEVDRQLARSLRNAKVLYQ